MQRLSFARSVQLQVSTNESMSQTTATWARETLSYLPVFLEGLMRGFGPTTVRYPLDSPGFRFARIDSPGSFRPGWFARIVSPGRVRPDRFAHHSIRPDRFARASSPGSIRPVKFARIDSPTARLAQCVSPGRVRPAESASRTVRPVHFA